MIVVASANGAVGIDAAWDVLASGGTALDAVEAGTRLVEDEPSDHTVGYGGFPNLVGEVELDASIMDGTTRAAGAVGGLRGYRAAITVARAVMERLPHVLVVGEGASRLAAELGLQPESLLTPEAEQVWRDGIEGKLPPGSWAAQALSQVASIATDPERASGTVNFLAIDGVGRMASAVSTSGWAWKYPGRVGDSPVIGAGNYCDARYGAAACTGFGELAIRSSTARTVVASLAAGRSLADAGRSAIEDLWSLGDVDPDGVIMHLVALGASGAHGAFSTRAGTTYVVRTESMSDHETFERTVVAGP